MAPGGSILPSPQDAAALGATACLGPPQGMHSPPPSILLPQHSSPRPCFQFRLPAVLGLLAGTVPAPPTTSPQLDGAALLLVKQKKKKSQNKTQKPARGEREAATQLCCEVRIRPQLGSGVYSPSPSAPASWHALCSTSAPCRHPAAPRSREHRGSATPRCRPPAAGWARPGAPTRPPGLPRAGAARPVAPRVPRTGCSPRAPCRGLCPLGAGLRRGRGRGGRRWPPRPPRTPCSRPPSSGVRRAAPRGRR